MEEQFDYFIKSPIVNTGDDPEMFISNPRLKDEFRLGLDGIGLYLFLFNYRAMAKENPHILTMSEIKNSTSDSMKAIKKMLKKIEDCGYLFKLQNKKNDKKGYLLTNEPETKESLNDYMNKKLSDWSIL
ncbi:MAG: hypothetical protein WC516_10080 [Patescibacteria group bacterium]|jgi:biotin operon repressor